MQVTFLKKNGDTYIAVRLPDPDELAEIERFSATCTESDAPAPMDPPD